MRLLMFFVMAVLLVSFALGDVELVDPYNITDDSNTKDIDTKQNEIEEEKEEISEREEVNVTQQLVEPTREVPESNSTVEQDIFWFLVVINAILVGALIIMPDRKQRRRVDY